MGFHKILEKLSEALYSLLTAFPHSIDLERQRKAKAPQSGF